MCTTQHIFLYTDTNKRQDSARCAPAAGAALRRCVAAPKCPPLNETGGRSGQGPSNELLGYVQYLLNQYFI